MVSNFSAVHPAAGEEQGQHEPRYVDFHIAPNDATWENGEPVLNKYSTFLTREHDFPGAKVRSVKISLQWIQTNMFNRPCSTLLVFPTKR